VNAISYRSHAQSRLTFALGYSRFTRHRLIINRLQLLFQRGAWTLCGSQHDDRREAQAGEEVASHIGIMPLAGAPRSVAVRGFIRLTGLYFSRQYGDL
jgi:hypothetical protein